MHLRSAVLRECVPLVWRVRGYAPVTRGGPMRNLQSGQATRLLFVGILATIALGTSIPNLYYALCPMYGSIDVVPDDNNRVIFTTPRSEAAGAKKGDRVAFEAMKPDDRFGGETGRFTPIGRRVTLLLERQGRLRAVTLTSVYHREQWVWALPVGLAKKTVSLVLILLASALFLLAPAALSRALFVYVIGCTPAVPYFFSFLTMYAYYIVTVAVDIIWSAGPIGFLLIATTLIAWRASRWTTIIMAAAFAVIFGLVIIADTRTMLIGLPSGAYYRVFDGARIACYLVATIVLVVALARTHLAAVRGAICLLIVAGSITILLLGSDHIPGQWLVLASQTARIAFKAVEEGGWTANAIASFAVVLVITRERVVDSGLVASRLLTYSSICFAIVAALVAVNWGFGALLAGYAVIIPLEIVGAVAIGYWFSGLRDVASALSMATNDAEIARIQGRFFDERDLLSRALGLALRTGLRGLIAEVQAHCSFSAWLSGDDRAFERHIDALSAALRDRSMRGLGAYLAAARGGAQHSNPNELREWSARACLLLCGSVDDVLIARWQAREAVSHASASSSPWLQVLSLVALGETSPAERRPSLEEARAIARAEGWLGVDKSLAALQANALNVGLLQDFVDARLRRTRPARPALEVSFFTGTVCAYGERIVIHEKELELLFTVAANRSGIRDDELLDRLWPDADGDAARNAFKVCLHRLRKSIGDSGVISRVGKRYELVRTAEVDLWQLQDAIIRTASRADGASTDALLTYCAALRNGARDRATLGAWFGRFEGLLQREMTEAEALLNGEPHDRRAIRGIRDISENE